MAEHEQAIKKAVENFPDTKWRIVTIPGYLWIGLDHSDTDGMILRTQLTPVFDKYDIDVVLQGHDHTYSRSKILYGDGKTHGSYEFRLDETGLDYDWDHAYNKNTGDSITLNPLSSDTAAVEARMHLQEIISAIPLKARKICCDQSQRNPLYDCKLCFWF